MVFTRQDWKVLSTYIVPRLRVTIGRHKHDAWSGLSERWLTFTYPHGCSNLISTHTHVHFPSSFTGCPTT